MKKENKKNAAVSGAGSTRVIGKVVNSNPKHRQASRRHIPLSHQPVRSREFFVGKDTGVIPFTAHNKQVTRFLQPIIALDRPVNIPVAYIAKHLKEEQRTNALLQGREGKHWPVKIEAGRSFGEGWEQFARDHELDIGYYLIFCHKGNMLFEVTVIDRTFCKREYPLFDVQDTIKIEEEEIALPKSEDVPNATSIGKIRWGCSEEDYPSFTMDLASTHVIGTSLNFPSSFSRINQLHARLKAEVILLDPSGKEFRGLKFSYNAPNNQLGIICGWKNYSKTQGLKEGDSITFMLTRNTQKIVQFQLHHEQSNGSKSRKCMNRLKQVELRHNNFTISLKKSNIHCGLIIRKSFANRNGLTHKGSKMVIKDGRGRSWEVSLTNDSRPTALGRGWVNVIRANGFKHGDVLKFQLIKNGKNPCNEGHSCEQELILQNGSNCCPAVMSEVCMHIFGQDIYDHVLYRIS